MVGYVLQRRIEERCHYRGYYPQYQQTKGSSLVSIQRREISSPFQYLECRSSDRDGSLRGRTSIASSMLVTHQQSLYHAH